MEQTNFERYKALKASFGFVKRGIQFNNVLAPQFVKLAYNPEVVAGMAMRDLVRPFHKTIDPGKLKEAFLSNDKVVTHISNRADYTELIDSYLGTADAGNRVYLPDMPEVNTFNAGNIVTAISFVFGKKDLFFKQKVYLAAQLAYHLNVLQSLTEAFNDFNLAGKKYIPFNSAYEVEALLTQFFAKRGVSTFHISHGLSYIKYNIPPYDAVNGDNITAGQVLVWGNSSKKDLIDNYNRDAQTIQVAGNPKYPFKHFNVKSTFKKGVVFLARPIYDADNVGLLKLMVTIVQERGITFKVKAHPLSNMGLFEPYAVDGLSFANKTSTINQLLEQGEFDFAVAYNTTAYYEAMYFDLPCLRYAVNENEKYNGLDDKFYDLQSFTSVTAQFKALNQVQLNHQVKQALTDNLGMGINNYKNIFDGIC